MLNDTLANVLSTINHYEMKGKKECTLSPVSTLAKGVLNILQNKRYVGSTECITDKKGGIFKLHLLGVINKCSVIKPRFSVNTDNIERYEKRYLPAKGMGVIIISTSQGLLTHEEAKAKNVGGRLIAYCY